MMEMGRFNTLKIVDFDQRGALLEAEWQNRRELVLLPDSQIPRGKKRGDLVEVFIYNDHLGRPLATTQRPYAQAGELA